MTSPVIARVAVDTQHRHLDRLFDYAVPESMQALVSPGVRVLVRFSGKVTDGFVIELAEKSGYSQHLEPLERVISAVEVLTPEQIQLAHVVAQHYGCTFYDVIRSCVPPRHAGVEKEPWLATSQPGLGSGSYDKGGLNAYPTGPAFLDAVRAGQSPRTFWQVAPVTGDDHGCGNWVAGIVQAVTATLENQQSGLIVLPDVKQANRVAAELSDVFGAGSVISYHSDLSRSMRYRSYLAMVKGEARIVVGTRSAIYAPVKNLGLIALWDEGNDSLQDESAPYIHARTVAVLRAHHFHTGLLLASWSRSVEAQRLIERSWLREIRLANDQIRGICPMVSGAGDSDFELTIDSRAEQSRLPHRAFETIRTGLMNGPVLIHVSRRGYLLALQCGSCRTALKCRSCEGPLRYADSSGAQMLECSWCGKAVAEFACPHCGSHTVRSPVVGAERTAEEIGRAFLGVPIYVCSAQRPIDQVSNQPCIVISTSGVEPEADGGYFAAVILDPSLDLARQDFRVEEETFRRWMQIVAKVRPRDKGGRVFVAGPAKWPEIQWLIRLDAANVAHTLLADRVVAQLPPASCMATIEGISTTISGILDALELPEGATIFGPVESGTISDATGALFELPLESVHIKIEASRRQELVDAVKHSFAVRSAKRALKSVRLLIDG